MSRCVVKIDKNKYPHHYMVVGLDPPLSCWFFQVYDERVGQADENTPCAKCDRSVFDCTCEEVVAWEPSIRSNGALLDHMQRWGVDLSDAYTKTVYDHIALDLDPGRVERR